VRYRPQSSDFFLWGCLKDKVYNSNRRTKKELKENIRREIANIPAEQLQRVRQNLFRRCEECLRVQGQHFQHFLLSVNCNYFIPNVIDKQALCIIGEIHNRIAAGVAPVVLKRSAVNRSTKERTSLYN
jgi:hypothetical protein